MQPSPVWRKMIRFPSAFFLLLVFNFMLPRSLPGDPLTTLFGEEAVAELTAETRADLIARLRLDEPVWDQFLEYATGIFRLDLGYSHHHGAHVLDIVVDFAPWTLFLTASSLLLASAFGTLSGLFAAWRRSGNLDAFCKTAFMVLNSFPPFILAMLLLRWLAISAGLFPLSGGESLVVPSSPWGQGLDILWHASLPILAFVLHETPNIFLLARSEALRWMGKPFVFVCRSKGLKDGHIRTRHIGLCIIPTLLSNAGKSLPAYVGGSMFVEIVFAYPGLGMLIFDSLQQHDYPMVQGILLLIGTATLLFNLTMDLITDMLHRRIAP